MTGQSSAMGTAIGTVVAAVVAPTMILVTAAVLVVALDSAPTPPMLAEIPPGSELPIAGVALSAADDTLYEGIEIQDLCQLGGDDTARFLATGARIQLTVDVVRGRGSIIMTGADRREGDVATAAVDTDRTVALEGKITPADGRGDPVQYILTANCDIPTDEEGKRAFP